MSEKDNNPINSITAGTVITGSVTANGDFRLDGSLEGDINLTGKLVVGEKGRVRGNVMCQNANIIGTIDGNLTVNDFLTLYATAVVKGDIVVNKLAIEQGALFCGTCRMQDELSAAE